MTLSKYGQRVKRMLTIFKDDEMSIKNIIFFIFISLYLSLSGCLSPNEALLNASVLGNKNDLYKALSDGADINTKDKDGITPLMYAVFTGNVENINILLANGAEINDRDSNGRTALFYAVQPPNHGIGFIGIKGPEVRLVPILISKGAWVNIKDKNGMTPLRNAMIFNDSEDIVPLLNAGADPYQNDFTGVSDIDFSKKTGDILIIDLWLKTHHDKKDK